MFGKPIEYKIRDSMKPGQKKVFLRQVNHHGRHHDDHYPESDSSESTILLFPLKDATLPAFQGQTHLFRHLLVIIKIILNIAIIVIKIILKITIITIIPNIAIIVIRIILKITILIMVITKIIKKLSSSSSSSSPPQAEEGEEQLRQDNRPPMIHRNHTPANTNTLQIQIHCKCKYKYKHKYGWNVVIIHLQLQIQIQKIPIMRCFTIESHSNLSIWHQTWI